MENIKKLSKEELKKIFEIETEIVGLMYEDGLSHDDLNEDDILDCVHEKIQKTENDEL